MDIELICGFCDSSLSVHASSAKENALVSLVHRFCNAHAVCGFVTPLGKDDSDVLTGTANIPVRRKVKRKLSLEDLLEEEDEDPEE